MMDFPTGPGVVGGPISPDAWKRAVYRSAPPRFYIELLPPQKQGNSYSFGIRVCPIKGDGVSMSSRGSNSEYEIWRRWEDCLWFQEALEVDYTRMSRDKRQRLAAGKGIKKNGIYMKSDGAASFESLPPGPDPNSIARDIHEFVPKLTKKGTLFRASQSTIEQRQRELQAMLDVLFQDEIPTLIKELRATRTFTDFFGFWRRDHDLAIKQQGRLREKQPRASIPSSAVSSSFSFSNTMLSEILPTPTLPESPVAMQSAPRSADGSSKRLMVPISHFPSSIRQPLSEPPAVRPGMARMVSQDEMMSNQSRISAGSSTSSSLLSSPSSRHSSGAFRMPIVPQDMPLAFGHNPNAISDVHGAERPTSILEVLPEGRELASLSTTSSTRANEEDERLPLRRRKLSATSDTNRNCQIFQGPLSFDSSHVPLTEGNAGNTGNTSRASRLSWQTTSSASSTRPASYLADLDVDFMLPTSPREWTNRRPRDSVNSVATFMTQNSADAVIPNLRSGRRRSLSTGSRQMHHSSVPEDGEWPQSEWSDNEEDREEDLLDAYFDDVLQLAAPESDRHFETHLGGSSASISTAQSEYYSVSSSSCASIIPRRTSTSTSISSDSASPYDGSISIKAVHNNHIVMLRAPRSLPFSDIRQRIYAKFVGQEGVPLCQSFAIASVLPRIPDSKTGRARSNSLSALQTIDQVQLQFMSSQEDWDQFVASSGGKNKLLVRVIGTVGS